MMVSVQEKLKSFAFEKAYPYIIEQPVIKDYLTGISFILVGSAATGLCTEESDVDICLICSREIYDIISVGTRWNDGRPTEVILEGTQLHYYAVSVDELDKKIDALDERACYVYGNAVVINDRADRYGHIAEKLHSPELMSRRFDMEFDMLKRRQGAVRYVLYKDTDPMARLQLGTEIIERLLKCIALYDGRGYDPRKRFYQTALIGSTGSRLKSYVDTMMSLTGAICQSADQKETDAFMEALDYCVDYLGNGGSAGRESSDVP
ncbi:MAG: nucleotidyltransferase domain-containing protein [Paludibacteraceae bacterium]|nr:nucleotidyltransferase domain-containing protein [Paludibacteraceae bacterium]